MKTDTTQQNIPSGWQVTTLGKVASITNGSTNTQDAIASGEYPLFDRSVEIKRSNKYLFDDTAVILPGEGAEFIPRIYSGKFDLHQRAYAIFPNKNIVNPAYLHHFLYANRKDFVKSSVGSTVKSLRLPLIQSIGVSIPPISEQQKIAEILGTVDEDIAKTQKVIEATEKLKRGLMQQLFTRGIGHTKFKETKIGQIPEAWEVKKLEQLCSKISDGVHKKPNYVPKGIPFVTVKNLTAGAGVSFKDLNYISENDHKEFTKRANPEKGDVLVTKDGTLGVARVVETESPFSIFVSVALLKPLRNLISPYFMKYGIESSVISDQFLVSNSGSALKHIHLIDFRSTLFPFPSMDEQLKIAEILSAVDEKISVNKKLKEKLTLLKKGLMQDLLSGKVRTNYHG